VPLHKRDVLFKQLTSALLKSHWQDKVLYFAEEGQCACVVLSKEQSQVSGWPAHSTDTDTDH
jgi:hypothetical protein